MIEYVSSSYSDNSNTEDMEDQEVRSYDISQFKFVRDFVEYYNDCDRMIGIKQCIKTEDGEKDPRTIFSKAECLLILMGLKNIPVSNPLITYSSTELIYKLKEIAKYEQFDLDKYVNDNKDDEIEITEGFRMELILYVDILWTIQFYVHTACMMDVIAYSSPILANLCKFIPLTPLTEKLNEWVDVTESMFNEGPTHKIIEDDKEIEEKVYQNARFSSVFCYAYNDDRSNRYERLDAIYFSEDGGKSFFSTKRSNLEIKMPYDVNANEPKTLVFNSRKEFQDTFKEDGYFYTAEDAKFDLEVNGIDNSEFIEEVPEELSNLYKFPVKESEETIKETD